MMTIVDAARAAIVSGAQSITVDPREIVEMAERIARLEARVDALERGSDPMFDEWSDRMDAQACACWG